VRFSSVSGSVSPAASEAASPPQAPRRQLGHQPSRHSIGAHNVRQLTCRLCMRRSVASLTPIALWSTMLERFMTAPPRLRRYSRALS